MKITTLTKTTLPFAAVALLAATSASQAAVINVDINDATYSGKGAVVDSGTTWNAYTSGGTATNMVYSDGSDSTVDFTVAPLTIDFEGPYGGSANVMNNYYLGSNALKSTSWDLAGLDVGQTYDLYFYGTLNATYTANAGIDEGSVTGSITSGAIQGLAAPDHSQWIEGTHYTVLRITSTAGVASGTFDGGAAQATLAGMQIVAVPEPSTTALLGLGGLALILRRRK